MSGGLNQAPPHRVVCALFGMTQAELADRIGVSYVQLNEIVSGRRGITPQRHCDWPRCSAPLPSSGSTASSRWTCTGRPTMSKNSAS